MSGYSRWTACKIAVGWRAGWNHNYEGNAFNRVVYLHQKNLISWIVEECFGNMKTSSPGRIHRNMKKILRKLNRL